jgi:hypothetical protein
LKLFFSVTEAEVEPVGYNNTDDYFSSSQYMNRIKSSVLFRGKIDRNLQFAINTSEKLAPLLCVAANSEIQGGTIVLLNPIPRPAIIRATMNMSLF